MTYKRLKCLWNNKYICMYSVHFYGNSVQIGCLGLAQVTMSAFIVDIRKIKDTQQGKQIWPYGPQYDFPKRRKRERKRNNTTKIRKCGCGLHLYGKNRCNKFYLCINWWWHHRTKTLMSLTVHSVKIWHMTLHIFVLDFVQKGPIKWIISTTKAL